MTNVEKALRAAIIEAWTKGLPATQHALARAVSKAGSEAKAPFTCSQRQVGLYFTKWAAAGVSTAQSASNGHAGAAYAFNWTGRPLDASTLLDAARPALESDAGAARRDPDANKLRTALRIALGVGEHGSDRALFAACAATPGTELHALPQRAYDAALATPRRAGDDGVEKASARNYRSTLRAFLRDAALQNRVPVVLPRVWASDVWEEDRDRYFGAPVGALSQTQRTLRVYWGHFTNAAKELPAPPADLRHVTLDMVEAICEGFRRRGEHEMPQHVKWMLRRVAREHGEGPYAASVGGRRTRNGHLNEDRLMGLDGEAAADGDWPTFVKMLDYHGYGPVWREHLEWYGDFITWPEHRIESEPARFPVRPARWELDATSRVKRVINCRTILYHAPVMLRRAPGELVPYDVFGGDGARVVLAGLQARWAERYKAGHVSSPNSDGLEKLVITVGLIARSLELRVRHALARGATDTLPNLGTVPLPQQAEAYAETYRSAGEKAKKIAADRARETSGHGENSVRSVARIVRNTPAAYWIQLLDRAVQRVQSHLVHDRHGVRTGALREGVDRKSFFQLVADTYYLGWLVTTGMRLEETVHVRLDLQYREELRALREAHHRTIDRKETPNTLPHEYRIRERYVPLWLENLYLEQARPFFMAEYPQLTRATKGGRVLKNARPAQDHRFLFVNTYGQPYGCIEENADGTGRDKLRLKARKHELRQRFKRFVGRLAHSLGMRVPTLPTEGSNHVVRISMGYELAQRVGLTAAANYLGDQEGSIVGRYQGVTGARVDAAAIAPGEFEDWEPPTVRARRERDAERPAPETQRRRGRSTSHAVKAPAAATKAEALATAPASLADHLDAEVAKLDALLAQGRIKREHHARMVDALVSRLSAA